jgi:hypothetical protein
MKELKEGEYHDYQSLIDSMEVETLLVKSDEDWQGDSFYLVQDAFGRVGYLQFGWGSCSGCDALQACDDNIYLLTGLRNDLYSEIKWFDARAEALEWFKTHDWEGDWVWHSGAGMAFVEEATKLLSEHVPAA